jgi:hypothetical protein
MSKFGNGTIKQDLYDYLSDLKNDHEVSQIVLCQEAAIVLAALIEEIKTDASIASIIATAKHEERNRIRNSL